MKITTALNTHCLSYRWAACVLLTGALQLAGVAAGQVRSRPSQLTWVRGRIERQGKPNYPAGKVAVTMVPEAYKNDESKALQVYTGEDGMYDFHVQAGTYVLKVWLSESEFRAFLIRVSARKYFDVAPIVIR